MLNAGGAVLVLIILIALLYLVDRGLCNTIEAIALWLLRCSRRLRDRRASVQQAQQQAIAMYFQLRGEAE